MAGTFLEDRNSRTRRDSLGLKEDSGKAEEEDQIGNLNGAGRAESL